MWLTVAAMLVLPEVSGRLGLPVLPLVAELPWICCIFFFFFGSPASSVSLFSSWDLEWFRFWALSALGK